LYAQLQTYWAPIHLLVGSEFLGSNFVVSNVQYSGNYNAFGSFEASATNIGIPTGIIMTTGDIYGNSTGPLGPNNMSNSGMDNGFGGSSLLTSISGYTTYNAAILEFDFVPSVDSLKLKYVFGSEEYPEYAPPNNTSYNDVFGIFISGPGISGIQNIAKLPNGTTVSINNVNSITNTSYFVYNGDGNTSPYNTSSQYIQYDGYTTPLFANKALQIGQTYHLQIAIADVGDGIFDSGIFIGSCETCDFNAEIEEVAPTTNLLYPNPANNELLFKVDKPLESVSIKDVYGKIVFTLQDVNSIDISDLPNGTYFLQMIIDGKELNEKFTVQH
jgi:hypothetical protein